MKNTIQQFINQGGKDVLKELENKNIIEETLREYRNKFRDYLRPGVISTIDSVLMANEFEEYLEKSLQKAINAERERCLGCVPSEQKLITDSREEYDTILRIINRNERARLSGINECRQEVINKIKEE